MNSLRKTRENEVFSLPPNCDSRPLSPFPFSAKGYIIFQFPPKRKKCLIYYLLYISYRMSMVHNHVGTRYTIVFRFSAFANSPRSVVRFFDLIIYKKNSHNGIKEV